MSILRPIVRPIIIDTDPGQDDAVAILLALASPDELEVLAITAVAGNVPLELTVINSLSVVELAGRSEVPVYRGSVRPMVNTLVTAEHVTGQPDSTAQTCRHPALQLGRDTPSTRSSRS